MQISKQIQISAIDKYYENLNQYVSMAAKGYANALVVVSDGGFGKSYQVLKTLAELNLVHGKDYEYITNYATPAEFYNFLYENKDKIIVVDDVEGLLTVFGMRGISLLKAALWSANGHRIIHYLTTSRKIRAPPSFEFTGRIIMLFNEMPKGKTIEALLSRTLYYEIHLSHADKLKIMEEIARQPYYDLTLEERLAVFNFIRDNSNEATENFNLRALIKIFNIYRYSKEHWQELALELLRPDEDLLLVRGLMNSGLSVKEQVRKFIEITGKHRGTYFRYKQKLVAKSH